MEIEKAARAASAHEFIMALPNGYDSEVQYVQYCNNLLCSFMTYYDTYFPVLYYR